MKKIMLAVDALSFQPEMLDFPAYIAALSRSRLTGVFMEDITPELSLRMDNPDAFAFMTLEEQEELLHRNTQKKISADAEAFRAACKKRGVIGKVFSEKGVPSEMIVEQSRYADLLLTNIFTTFSSLPEHIPSVFTRHLMINAECPVIIAPDKFNGIEELVFAFDGSASSSFAIRQFTYLLPELADKKATVLYSKQPKEEEASGQEALMEWMDLHYEEAYFKKENGSILDGFLNACHRQPAIMGIMGAYGRNALSRFFRESSANDVLQFVSIPLFIAHY